jgi:hypothetical protein
LRGEALRGSFRNDPPLPRPRELIAIFVVGRLEGQQINKEAFMFRYALAAALILTTAAPAFAAKGFYIVRGADKKCTVVETVPMATETTVTRVGKDVYVTREEAESDLAVVCVTEDRGRNPSATSPGEENKGKPPIAPQ